MPGRFKVLWREIIAAVSDVLISCTTWRAEPEAFQAALNRIDLEKARLQCGPWRCVGGLGGVLCARAST